MRLVEFGERGDYVNPEHVTHLTDGTGHGSVPRTRIWFPSGGNILVDGRSAEIRLLLLGPRDAPRLRKSLS